MEEPAAAATQLPPHHPGIHYIDFLAWLVRARDVSNYLEIGVNAGNLFYQMQVDNAIGVDPQFVLSKNVAYGKKNVYLVQKTSDRFFLEEQALLALHKPQLVFLDGMHLFEYLLRDFINSEAACVEDSLIIMHDCMPLHVGMVDRSQDAAFGLTEGTPYHGMWTGDVWKIVPILRKYRPDLKVTCLDAAPTGLVCVTGLDPKSTILKDNYLEIAHDFSAIADSDEKIDALLYSANQTISVNTIMSGLTHGIYFL